MECGICHTPNPAGAVRCAKCATPLPLPSDYEATLGGAMPGWSPPPAAKTPGGVSGPAMGSDLTADGLAAGWSKPASGRTAEGLPGVPVSLQPEKVLGGRYEILQMLGQGGMGAVYKARDRELDRLVALKVIRPELAGHPEILKRFKQELILARQVTHKNVIRIFDLSEAEGLKFITMEYVEGRDLKSTLTERGKFAPEEAAGIMEQACRALDAAHSEGVVHRDLKPQNIMIDPQGAVKVMDFGIARSMETPGMTQTGALVGTPEYMSPEQALGEDVDARSDLFTLGIIFYELLTGKTPFHANTAVAMLVKRTRERAIPPVKEDASIPPYLSNIVVKCLETDPKLRYQGAKEILQDLEARHAPRTSAFTVRMPRLRMVEEFPTKWIAPALAAILLIVGIVFRAKLFGPTTTPKPTGPAISLAILPLRNASGDASLDWMGANLAEMLRTDVGQSSYLQSVSSDRVNQILHDLRIAPDSNIDPDTLRRIAEFTSADRVLSGFYAKYGNQLRIDATLRDWKRQRTVSLKAEVPSEKELPRAIEQLAQDVQKNLALPTDIIKELQAKALRPSTQSIQALRYYNEGIQLTHQGKNLDAQKSFQAAVKEDPNFSLAYAQLGQTYAALGYDNEAEQAARKAVDQSEKLPPQEKYLIAAIHAQTLNDTQKAIDAYENLAKVLPNDSDVQYALAGLYNNVGSFDKAREYYGKLLAVDPKNVEALIGMGGVEIMAGNSEAGLEYLNRALPIAIELGNDEEKSTIKYGLGVAYNQLSKPEEALSDYQQALEIKQRLGEKRGIALTLNGMAQIQDAMGKADKALKSFQEALRLRREMGDKRGVGDTLIDLANFYDARGQYDQSLSMLQESLRIQRDVGNQPYEALCLNNIGSIYADKGLYDDALTYYQQALRLRERSKDPTSIADSANTLGDVYAKFGQYDQAITNYLRALELWRSVNDKRHAAFTSYGLGIIYEQQGRLGAALNAKAEALKAVRELQDKFGLAEILGGYAESLNLLGRSEEAQKDIDEALAHARDLKGQALVAQNLNYQGESYFYRGDYKTARARYEQALQVASKTNDRRLTLISKFNLAKVAVEDGRSREAIASLRALADQADTIGLKYLSVECSVYLGEALMRSKDYGRARQELDRSRGKSEKLGLQVLRAKSEYLLGTVLRLGGDAANASSHYAAAQRILDEIRKETNSDTFLKRADLGPIYSESARYAQASPS